MMSHFEISSILSRFPFQRDKPAPNAASTS
jgi:hypothetical protein